MTRIYATLRKRYTTEALKGMGFVKDGGLMMKRRAMRRVRAQASSLDGVWWRVTRLERRWR
ncbi:hypothetical protein QCE73_36920 [Caballeronia sp. LZ029]|uniref:hypothetical protein n=1 Tax=Caballeronia sp. LZ029 TaxID=3038564 RepID=UPI0028648499|nr:hypothetical protein [Caballeronia sp. LZ029]MDR5748767.1 hypothetical protein [Caballeronia sp. LZ029]